MGCSKKMKSQVEQYHYFNEYYDTKEYFISYWQQINEIYKLNPNRVLEIGIGSGFISTYLKRRDINIKTLDFDRQLTPDIVGSVLNIPFKNNSFDIVACYEVLEHLPFDNVSKALIEIYRITKSSAILSLPDVYPKIRIHVQIPLIRIIKKIITLPKIKKETHTFNGQHYWELGKSGYSLKDITTKINKVGFKIDRTYRLFEHPYHRFFILNKK